MAADTRPYKSKEQDGQGNELIIRDQQLVEQASQTTMASGEYFEIVDVDGRMAKIPKANMVDIVREALGSLLNGLSDQTTVTKVPSLNGNTLGASTVATLASVLGVPYISGSIGMKVLKVEISQGSSYTLPNKCDFLFIARNSSGEKGIYTVSWTEALQILGTSFSATVSVTNNVPIITAATADTYKIYMMWFGDN